VRTPDDVSFKLPHPMPGPDTAALLACFHLVLQRVDDCLPISVASRASTSYLESWEVTRAAFVARIASTLRHLSYLAPSHSRLDGAALARTLVELVITFAWISGQPKERLPRFLSDGFHKTLRKHAKFSAQGVQLLDDAPRVRLEEYLLAHPKKMPSLADRADEADASWRDRVASTLHSSMQIPDFRELYDKVYDQLSTLDHASTLSLQTFVHLTEPPLNATVDGEPERNLAEDLRPYWLAMFATAEALVVSSLASGRPRLGSLQEALGLVANLRDLETSGRIVVTETSDGVTIGLAGTDADDPGPPS
jgi:hypothetical protein